MFTLELPPDIDASRFKSIRPSALTLGVGHFRRAIPGQFPIAPKFKVGTKPWAHGFVPKSAAGTDFIPTLQCVAGITANEMTIECPHCQIRQKVYAARSEFAQKRSQYVSCINCQSEFDVKAPDKIKS